MDHVFVLYDRASNSVWYPGETSLEAVGGDRKGEKLPFLDEMAPMTLADWLKAQPDSTVLLPTEEDALEMNRPYLGIGLDENDGALVISRIGEDSPAAEAGLELGDTLRAFDGRSVASRSELREMLLEFSAGDAVEVAVERDGEPLSLTTTLVSH
jgi:predicted metalloprotease with PDZ domain